MSARAQFPKLMALFEEVVDLPEQDRSAWMDAHCPAALRDELEAMLRADDTAQTLDHGPPASAPSLPGYDIAQRLGEGGMGSVYAAVRTGDDYRQDVAIKFLHRHLVGGQFDERFGRERAILARLEHPHIARLIDGGTTADGQPYLVMERVAGRNLLEHSQEHDSPIDRRLEYFIQVCEAVQAAHAALIVHRDIKPSNVVITETGRVVLLDFGIAKVLEDGAEAGPATRVMTPQYASPEQLRGEAVSTLTDVYALGVLLYELLCEQRPFADADGAELIQRVTETQPPAPSVVVQSRAPRIAQRLRGDLDLIVARAMHTDPSRRYSSAAQLADDVRRFLAHEPVTARPDSIWYRFKRLVQRQRLAAALVSVLIVIVAAGTLALWQQVRETRAALKVAEAERLAAQGVTDFLVDLFELADPTGERSQSLSVQEMLRRGSQRVIAGEESMSDPQRRRLGITLAHVMVNLADYEAALALLDGVEARADDARGDLVRGLALRGLDQHDAAQSLLRAAAESGETSLQLDARFALAMAHRDRGDYRQHLAALTHLLPQLKAVHGAEHPDIARALLQTGSAHWLNGDMDRARSFYEQALTMQQRLLSPDHPQLGRTLLALSTLAHRRAEYPLAEQYGLEALRIHRSAFGEDHLFVAQVAANLGAMFLDAGDAARARGYLETALNIEAARSPLPASHANTLGNLGLIDLREGRFTEASSWLERSLAIAEPRLGSDHPQVAAYRDNLGLAMLRLNQLDQSEALFQQALSSREQNLGPDHPHLAYSLLHLAEVAQLRGEVSTAVELAQRAVMIRREKLGEEHELTQTAVQSLAAYLAETGK